MLERTASVAIAPTQALTGRRILFAALCVASLAAILWLAASALAGNGHPVLNAVLLVLFAVTLPWIVIGFWNSAIGFLLMRFARDSLRSVLPAARRIRGDEPVAASTAILFCIRNEPHARVTRNLLPMMEGLAASGHAARFHVYILSDRGEAAGDAERAHFAKLADAWKDRLAVTYRRRAANTGFKAGNIADFCARFGAAHDFALPLDADSFMTADAMLRIVRIMQASPEIGILQSLVVGMPSTSAFARLFQFGMRLSMRSFTLGSAWWQGDCGPYWGHNAIFRIAPFMAHCALPVLPARGLLGGYVLSHDQIEAVLMRRAGYEVRVLPEEDGSFEENPPTLIEFIRRDLRWCQGNMQYWHFLGLPGLRFISRYQLAFALLMFLGSPAWMGLLATGTLAVALSAQPAALVSPGPGLAVYLIVVLLWFAPKAATLLDILTRRDARKSFGGTFRLLASFAAEGLFSVLLLPIMFFGHTLFLARLLLGKTVGWGGQMRDDHAVPWSLAARHLWPQTLFGAVCIAILAASHPPAIPYALFIAAGLVLAVPLAVLTASPGIGRALARLGIGRLPEETQAPAALRALGLPAFDILKRGRA
ncbi:MAG: glucans biosynthesis glucosyltransferase MdoH [Pseudorhodoplanes sp.]